MDGINLYACDLILAKISLYNMSILDKTPNRFFADPKIFSSYKTLLKTLFLLQNIYELSSVVIKISYFFT